jgi:hypothetical protein
MELQDKNALFRQLEIKCKGMPPTDIWAVADYYVAEKKRKLTQNDPEDGKASP